MNLYLWSLNSTLTRFILKSETETFVIILVSVQLGTKKKNCTRNWFRKSEFVIDNLQLIKPILNT